MINNSDIKVSYRGNGQTTIFPFTFPFIKPEYIHVAIYDSLTDKTKILETDYYVDAVAGTVTYPGWPPGQEPAEALRPPILPETSVLTIFRQTDIDQLINLGQKYPLPEIERMIDKLTEIVQELGEGVSRAIKAEIGSPYTPEEMYEQMNADAEMARGAAQQTAQDVLTVRGYYLDADVARRQAQISATESTASAGHARAEANRAENAAGTATSQAASVGVLANAAKDTMAGYAAYTAPPWNAGVVYSYPTVVSYTDGSTYRCIGENVPAGEKPDGSQLWVRITTRGGDDFFDIDLWGALMPSENPTSAYGWTLDTNGDIMPKDASDTLGRETQTVAEEALERAEEALEKTEELIAALPMELDDDGDATTTAAE